MLAFIVTVEVMSYGILSNVDVNLTCELLLNYKLLF